jgi:ABC-type sugar transport system substrate-binding protein
MQFAGHSLLFIALLAASAGSAACRPQSPHAEVEISGFIAVVGVGESDPLWPVLQAATARFHRQTPTAHVRAEAPPTRSVNLQIQLVRRLRREGMRGCCLQVSDPQATVGVLEALRADGAVVVTMMQPVETSEPFLHAGINEREVGAALADGLADQVPEQATLGVLYDSSDHGTRLRHEAFQLRMVRYPRLTVLRSLDCGGEPAAAVRLIRETTKRFPGIDGWAAMGTWPLLARAENQTLLPEGRALVLPGPLADFDVLVDEGTCQAIVVTDYHEIVSRALQMCWLTVRRETLQLRRFEPPARIVTAENLSEFRKEWARWTSEQPDPPPS